MIIMSNRRYEAIKKLYLEIGRAQAEMEMRAAEKNRRGVEQSGSSQVS